MVFIFIHESVYSYSVYTHYLTVRYCDWIKNTWMNMNLVNTNIYVCISRNKVILKPRLYWWMRAAMILSLFLPITARYCWIDTIQPAIIKKAWNWMERLCRVCVCVLVTVFFLLNGFYGPKKLLFSHDILSHYTSHL